MEACDLETDRSKRVLTDTATRVSNSTPAGTDSGAPTVEERLRESLAALRLSTNRSWCRRLAGFVSIVGSPPILTSSAVMLTALKTSGPGAWTWGAVYVLVGVLVPFLYVVRLVRKGQIRDIHVRVREERRQPLLVTLVCAGAGLLLLALGRAPGAVTAIAATLWLQVVTIFFITLKWKISVHTAAAAGAAMVARTLLGTTLPLLVVVPLVAWSRVCLRHHTLPETAAGAFLGSTVFLAAGPLMHMS